jgi:hypothetical protein
MKAISDAPEGAQQAATIWSDADWRSAKRAIGTQIPSSDFGSTHNFR